jgi:hypothetical protein
VTGNREVLMKRVGNILKNLIPQKWTTKLWEQLVARSVTHVFGPKRIPCSRNTAIVTCVVRNGEFYIESFIRHYQRMGFRHIVLLDNGSSDDTVTLAREFQNVSVWRSTLPIEAHQRLFKRYLAKRFGQGGWCLDADIDEFFEFPGSDEIELTQLLDYLNRNRYTAVVTQLADMFSARPLSELEALGAGTLQEEYPYYDISNVKHEPYAQAELTGKVGGKNVVGNEATDLLWGGIRRTLWGNHCLLTKHSLFFQDRDMELFSHVHFHNNARLADVSCAMLHYKLAGDISAVAEQNRIGFSGNGKGYRDCIEFIRSNPNYQVKQATAKRLSRVSELVESGFLFASSSYGKYVKELSAANAAPCATAGSGR